MTIRELSDYLLELLDSNDNIDDCQVMIYSSANTGRDIYHIEIGAHTEKELIPACNIQEYDENEIEPCLIFYDHEVEFEREKTLADILGF